MAPKAKALGTKQVLQRARSYARQHSTARNNSVPTARTDEVEGQGVRGTEMVDRTADRARLLARLAQLAAPTERHPREVATERVMALDAGEPIGAEAPELTHVARGRFAPHLSLPEVCQLTPPAPPPAVLPSAPAPSQPAPPPAILPSAPAPSPAVLPPAPEPCPPPPLARQLLASTPAPDHSAWSGQLTDGDDWLSPTAHRRHKVAAWSSPKLLGALRPKHRKPISPPASPDAPTSPDRPARKRARVTCPSPTRARWGPHGMDDTLCSGPIAVDLGVALQTVGTGPDLQTQTPILLRPSPTPAFEQIIPHSSQQSPGWLPDTGPENNNPTEQPSPTRAGHQKRVPLQTASTHRTSRAQPLRRQVRPSERMRS